VAKATVKQTKTTHVVLKLTEEEAVALYALVEGLRLPAQAADVEAALGAVETAFESLDLDWPEGLPRIKYLGYGS